MNKFSVLITAAMCVSLAACAGTGAGYAAANHPALTPEQMVANARQASDYLAASVAAGKEKEALEEFQRAPRFRITDAAWGELAKRLNNEKLLGKLQPLRGGPFEEFKDLWPILRQDLDETKTIEASKLVIAHAQQVDAGRWAAGSAFDWRFVVTYACRQNMIKTQPFKPGMVDKPILNTLKDAKDKFYVLGQCEYVTKHNKPIWSVSYHPSLERANELSPMWIYMMPVKGTDYQIGVFSRILPDATDIAALNSRISD